MIVNTELYQKFRLLQIDKLVEEDKEDLLKIFMVISNTLIRDWISFIFAEVKFNKSVPFILEKIHQHDNLHNSSSLILSLKDLDIKDYFIEVVKILCLHGYESRQLAYEIIKDNVDDISDKVRIAALKMLTSETAWRNQSEEEGLGYVESAINVLTR